MTRHALGQTPGLELRVGVEGPATHIWPLEGRALGEARESATTQTFSACQAIDSKATVELGEGDQHARPLALDHRSRMGANKLECGRDKVIVAGLGCDHHKPTNLALMNVISRHPPHLEPLIS